MIWKISDFSWDFLFNTKTSEKEQTSDTDLNPEGASAMKKR